MDSKKPENVLEKEKQTEKGCTLYRPFLRIATGPGKKKYLTVAIKHSVGSRVHLKTLMNFGSANNPENWDRAIECVLSELKCFYSAFKEQFIARQQGNTTKNIQASQSPEIK